MTEISIVNDVEVKLVRHTGDDSSIVQAARVSVVGENFEEFSERDSGLINYLLREKHGSPFEHNSMTFFIKAPIFVWREHMRHRVGWSYNEQSGRYSKLAPEFYSPAPERPLVNVGTSAKPEFAPGNYGQQKLTEGSLRRVYTKAWTEYESMLSDGIANEVARLVLPVAIMSSAYVTCNARSLMSFLSLRTQDERATHVSRPQYEIELVARKLEAEFENLFPTTYEAYNKYGRVAP